MSQPVLTPTQAASSTTTEDLSGLFDLLGQAPEAFSMGPIAIALLFIAVAGWAVNYRPLNDLLNDAWRPLDEVLLAALATASTILGAIMSGTSVLVAVTGGAFLGGIAMLVQRAIKQRRR